MHFWNFSESFKRINVAVIMGTYLSQQESDHLRSQEDTTTDEPPRQTEPVPQRQATDPSSRQKFTEEPWRKTKGWGRDVRDDLRAEISSCRPHTKKLHVNSFNIVLMGEIGSGKSSFFNSINSVFKDKFTAARASVGKREKSLTTEFMMYNLGQNISIRIGDTMGLQMDTSEADIENILSVVDGHVPHGHRFTPNEKFGCDSADYIANPTIEDKAHCAAIVIDASKSHNMHVKMVEKLKSLAEGLYHRKVPFIVLLTHLDEFCEDVKGDIEKTFRAISVRDLLDKVSSMVLGLAKNQIYPVINYQEDVELDDNMDILLLYALRYMVDAAQGHFDTIESLQKQPAENNSQLKYSQQEQGDISHAI